jgi:hypothetical protein
VSDRLTALERIRSGRIGVRTSTPRTPTGDIAEVGDLGELDRVHRLRDLGNASGLLVEDGSFAEEKHAAVRCSRRAVATLNKINRIGCILPVAIDYRGRRSAYRRRHFEAGFAGSMTAV